MIYLLGQKSGNVSLDTTGKKKKKQATMTT